MSVHTVLAKLFSCILSAGSLWLRQNVATLPLPWPVTVLLQPCSCCHYWSCRGLCWSSRWNTASHSNLQFSSFLMHVLSRTLRPGKSALPTSLKMDICGFTMEKGITHAAVAATPVGISLLPSKGSNTPKLLLCEGLCSQKTAWSSHPIGKKIPVILKRNSLPCS